MRVLKIARFLARSVRVGSKVAKKGTRATYVAAKKGAVVGGEIGGGLELVFAVPKIITGAMVGAGAGATVGITALAVKSGARLAILASKKAIKSTVTVGRPLITKFNKQMTGVKKDFATGMAKGKNEINGRVINHSGFNSAKVRVSIKRAKNSFKKTGDTARKRRRRN